MATYDLASSVPATADIFGGDILNCTYSGTYKTVTLPAGQYTLEVWGAQGGSYSTTYAGGKGGYSYGTLTLTAASTILYLCVGGQGTSTGTSTSGSLSGGYNGGGGSYSSSTTYLCSAGGGGSDIRIGTNSVNYRIIVAGGGGGSGSYNSSYRQSGGAGGGTSGITGGQYNTSYLAGTGGSATAAGTSYYGTTTNSTSYGTVASFGQGGSAATSSGVSGGGGGWYGGGYGRRSSGGGGSGYVYTSSTASSHPYNSSLGSSYYLTSAATVAGNTSFTDYSGSTVTGHSGNGYARITAIETANDTITNGSWTYTPGGTLTPTTTLQTTSSWTLTGTTCKKFKVIPSASGYLTIYANSTIDTYGYIGSTDSTTIGSNGTPANYDYYNDDDGDDYGGTPSTAFGFYIPVVAGETYYLWVRPYNTSNSASTTISYKISDGPTIIAQYLKVDDSTWVKI